MRWWHFGAAMNTVALVACLAIGVHLFRGVRRSGRLLANTPALAVGLVLLASAVHHGSHAGHLLLSSEGMRDAFDGWHASAFDIVSAGVALWCWHIRHRLVDLVVRDPAPVDLEDRERRALEINDNVVQHLAVAKLAHDLGKHDDAYDAISKALESSRAIITDLLGEHGSRTDLAAGDLRREHPGGSEPRE